MVLGTTTLLHVNFIVGPQSTAWLIYWICYEVDCVLRFNSLRNYKFTWQYFVAAVLSD